MVTFGNGAIAPILDKCIVNISGLPANSDVLYVKGLNSNLSSINQICDDDFEVSFIHKRCTIYDPIDNFVFGSVRTSDNCYGVLPNFKYVYSSVKIDVIELWH